MNWFQRFASSTNSIDHRIEEIIGRKNKRRLVVHSLNLPGYRFVDVYRALEAAVADRAVVEKIETEQNESLNQLLHDPPQHWSDRTTRNATKVAWQVSADNEQYLPVDCFWICPSGTLDDCAVFRLQFIDYTQQSRIEVASASTEAGKAALDDIIEKSRANSIYIRRVLQLTYESGKKDEYGDIEKPERFQVVFSPIAPVEAQDIVLSDQHIEVLQRNIIDLHHRREILARHGVPARRGVLLHGPPGTGKTFACRHLCHQLPDVTRIFVTGTSLVHVAPIFAFARLFNRQFYSLRTLISSSAHARSTSIQPRSATCLTKWTVCARTKTSAWS